MSLQPHFAVYYRYDFREKPKVDELGLNFDEQIKTWKQSLEHSHNLESAVRFIQSINKAELVPINLVGSPIITTESVSDSQIANPSFQTESLHTKYGIDENILKEKLKAKGAVEGRFNEAIIDEVMNKLRNLCNSHASYEENLKYTQMKIELSHAPGYQLTGDNVDLYVKVKHMSSTNQNSSIHWFNINAVLNRVNNNQLNNNKPIMSVLEMQNSQFLPSAQDNVNILQGFIPLSCVLVTNISALQQFKKSVVWHIPHKYTNEMKQKSTQV